MLGFGILAIIIGLIFQGVELFGFGASETLMGIVILIVSILGFVEIGLKKLLPPKFSRLKKLGTQQIVSLIITSLVLLTGISLLAGFSLGFFSSFAGGTLLFQGLIIIIEAFR